LVDTQGAPTLEREISPIPGKSDRRPTPEAYDPAGLPQAGRIGAGCAGSAGPGGGRPKRWRPPDTFKFAGFTGLGAFVCSLVLQTSAARKL